MYLFFIREFNDIDHITPIVWKMRCDKYTVAVYCLNPEYDLQNDYRLRFLKRLGIKVRFIFDECALALGLSHGRTRFISRTYFRAVHMLDKYSLSASISVLAKYRRRIKRKAKRYYKQSRKEFYDVSWARAVLAKTGAQILCFDHVNPDRYVVDIFLQAANEKSIPTVSLPHGVFIYTNNFVRDGSAEEDRYDKFNRFDYIITQNELRKNVLTRAGVHREKISVLGSARYSNDWMTQNNMILPRIMKPNTEDSCRLKAVFMTTRFAYRIDVERMLKTFDLLSRIDGIEVVVKPHTRSGEEAKVYETIPLSNVYEFSSVELCEWADIMLVIGSSILIETLVQRKPVLYLKYLHENTTQYEEFGACWTIRDETQLKDALLALQENKTKVPYTDENVDRFLSEIIYGGQGERDVLGDYENFIVSRGSNEAVRV